MPRRTATTWPMPDLTDWPMPDLEDMTSAWGDLATDLASAYGSFMGTVAAPRHGRHHAGSTRKPSDPRHRSAHGGHPESGRCRACGTRCGGSCHCTCCVSDADLVVRTRLGERRVVPVTIHNQRQRTRTITLDLSDFRTSGGGAVPVTGRIVTPTEFELEGCSTHDTILVLESTVDDGGFDSAREDGRSPRDVDDCTVAYADLRIQGCDVRPVRIAVLVLPRDCDPYEVHCACSCC